MISLRHFRLAPLLASVFLAPLAGCSPADALNAAAAKASFRQVEGIAYGPSARLRLDVYAPASETAPESKRPVIVFFYGGSWQRGERSDYLFVGAALAARGFMAVIPDYRLYPEAPFPGFVEDGAKSIRWARDHAKEFGGDPERIFVMGHSAGAQIAALLAFDHSYLAREGLDAGSLRGLIGLSGPYDFLPLSDPKLKSVFPEASRPRSQPIGFVKGGEIPVFLGVGGRDRTVDPGNTARLNARLEEVGDRVELHRYASLGHAAVVAALAAPFHRVEPVFSDVSRFVESH